MDPASPDIRIFEYRPGRSGENTEKSLEGFHVILVHGQFFGYNRLAVEHAACWAHMLREFVKELSPDPSNPFDLLPEHVSGTATVHKVEALIRAVGSERAADLLHMSKAGMYKRLRTARAKNLPAGPTEEPYGEGDLKF